MTPGRQCILVVDDDDMIRDSLSLALDDEGFETRGAGNGREALRLLRRWRPDLILLDLMMPDLDGWTFRREQRRVKGCASIPVVIVSAVYVLADEARALAAAAAFPKPFDLNELIATVSRLLGSPYQLSKPR